jgi:hypothetical protein
LQVVVAVELMVLLLALLDLAVVDEVPTMLVVLNQKQEQQTLVAVQVVVLQVMHLLHLKMAVQV